jgi:hypothetical protein
MSTDNKTNISKQKSKTSLADPAANAKKGKNTETELTDEELGYVSGGTAQVLPKRTSA